MYFACRSEKLLGDNLEDVKASLETWDEILALIQFQGLVIMTDLIFP